MSIVCPLELGTQIGVKNGHFEPFMLKSLIEAYFGFQNPHIANFHKFCHRNFAPKVFWRDSRAQKLDFRGLRSQFDAKKPNFRGLIGKIGNWRTILVTRPILLPISMEYTIGILPSGILRKLDFRDLKGQFDVKKASFRRLIAEIGYLRRILGT